MEMTCPKCHDPMRQYERSGVTIDQCTECRGIFLDRGELDKIFDAEAAWNSRQQQATPPPGQNVPPAGQYAPLPVAPAAEAADRGGFVGTQGHLLAVPDFIATLVVEAAVHHLDLAVA